MTTWIYDDAINPTDYHGFVYKITNLHDGRIYSGQKSVWSISGKGKKQTRKESNWKRYRSSCTDLKADVKLLGKRAFRREVLHWCKDKRSTTFLEVKEQFAHEVLERTLPDGRRASDNGNIIGRFFSSPI